MKIVTSALIASALAVSVIAQTPKAMPQKSTSDSSSEFIRKVEDSGHREVRTAQLAEKTASNQKVKDYAKMLEQDHSNANRELMQIAQKHGVTLPDYAASDPTVVRTAPRDTHSPADTSASPSHTADAERAGQDEMAITELSRMQGASFDRRYIDMMVTDHRKAIGEFESMQKMSPPADLKQFIDKTLPTLRTHLQRAESLQSELGKK